MNLTEKQQAILEEYIKNYSKFIENPSSTSEKEVEDAVIRLYEKEKQERPEIVWVNGPQEGLSKVKELLQDKTISKDDILSQINFGTYENTTYGLYDFVFKEIRKEKNQALDDFIIIAKNTFCYWTLDKAVVLVKNPKIIKIKELMLHSDEGPALVFDGEYPEEIYAKEGVLYTSLLEMSMADKYDRN